MSGFYYIIITNSENTFSRTTNSIEMCGYTHVCAHVNWNVCTCMCTNQRQMSNITEPGAHQLC